MRWESDTRASRWSSVLLLLLALVVSVVRGHTATFTPDAMVCLPMVVDYEGYGVLAGVIAGCLMTAVYIFFARREGLRRAQINYPEVEMVEHRSFPASGGDAVDGESLHSHDDERRGPPPESISLAAAAAPEVREEIRSRLNEPPPPPPR